MSTVQGSQHSEHNNRRVAPLVLFALGVVFGDIGTSPLYALRECFAAGHGIAISQDNVFGILSLVFWSLIIVISVKYVAFVMRADNHGEGGIFALLTLILSRGNIRGKQLRLITAFGLLGTALFYGDGILTPAISVISAVEGLKIATPVFDNYVIPITVCLLVLLFVFQSRGSSVVGSVFGPIMVLWFLTLSILGSSWIIEVPEVLKSVNPIYAVNFFLINKLTGFFVLGSVFLVVTGGEALYADIGHFGKLPIRIAWFSIALPALLLNYFGQGALLIRNPESLINPFYLLSPSWGLYPLVLLSTAATIIASQAVITGAFSLTRQALHLGYIPRLHVSHTSHHEIGQVYVPIVNWILLVGTVGVVIGFGSSGGIAGAYGLAVVLLMVVTTILMFICSRRIWGWTLLIAGLVVLSLLLVDFAFLGSNLLKFNEGAWFPLLITLLLYFVFITWKRGRTILGDRIRREQLPMNLLLSDLDKNPPLRVPGTAVFMSSNPLGVPRTLLHNFKHNRVLHERVILLTIVAEEVPRVSTQKRIEINELGHNFFRILAHYGFMETPNVPNILDLARNHGLEYVPNDTTFFLGRETLVLGRSRHMYKFQKHLFIFMSRIAQDATQHFGIPTNRAIEIGIQVEI